MEPIVFEETDGEVYDTGAVRLRLLAQSPDQSIAITDNTVPPGFPGPVRHRHAEMTDIFYVLQGELAFELEGAWRSLGPGVLRLGAAGGGSHLCQPRVGAGPVPQHLPALRQRAVGEGGDAADDGGTPVVASRDGPGRRPVRLRASAGGGVRTGEFFGWQLICFAAGYETGSRIRSS